MPLLEYAYNKSVHVSTQETPFYITYRYHPKSKRRESPAMENFAKCLMEIHSIMKEYIKEDQSRYNAFANVEKKTKLSSR